jgi:predicted ATPase
MSPGERLVGREPVLAAARSVLRDAFAGNGQLLLISGEAGIGKTAVVATLIDHAAPDCTVLRGSCWEGNGAPPYWPWSQVLRATGRSIAELGDAGRLLDNHSSPTRAMDASAAADAQFRVCESVALCLADLAADRPLLIALDDLHWADEPSVRLLGFWPAH